MDASEDNCSICLCSFGDEVTVTKCNHKFCTGCLEKWLENHSTCPMCRTSFKIRERDDDEDEDENSKRRELYQARWNRYFELRAEYDTWIEQRVNDFAQGIRIPSAEPNVYYMMLEFGRFIVRPLDSRDRRLIPSIPGQVSWTRTIDRDNETRSFGYPGVVRITYNAWIGETLVTSFSVWEDHYIFGIQNEFGLPSFQRSLDSFRTASQEYHRQVIRGRRTFFPRDEIVLGIKLHVLDVEDIDQFAISTDILPRQ